MRIAVLCVGLLGLLVFVLGLAVSLLRGRSRTYFGYAPDPTDRLYKMVRAHGNATEYAPMLAVLIVVLALQGAGRWWSAAFVAATVFRYLHAVGIIMCESLDRPDPLRFVGALGTYVSGIALALAVIL